MGELEKQNTELQLNNPADISRFAITLNKFIKQNKLSTLIQGKEYVHCDGWKFAGLNFGITAIAAIPTKEVSEIIKYTKDNKEFQLQEIKYSCSVELIRLDTGNKIGAGWAICSNAELKKRSFDEYAIASMAQTRAIGKAFRNLIGFVMQAAGFETTPAEEMEEKYAKGQTPQGEVEEEVQIEILRMTTVESLFEYAESLKHLHKNKQFRQLVNNRKNEIENGKS